jgi:hypothetical protein
MRYLNQMLVALGSRQVAVAILLAIVIAGVALALSAGVVDAARGGGVTANGSGICMRCG